jgi:hypothetical protein
MKALLMFLVVSLAANAVMSVGWWRRAAGNDRVPVGASAPVATEVRAVPEAKADLRTLAPAALRTELVQRGLPAEAVAAIVQSRIYAAYDTRRRELVDETVRNSPWWVAAGLRLDAMRVLSPAQRKELRDLETEARHATLRLLGPAALDPEGMIALRFAFVPPEKAVQLDALERDYENLRMDLKERSRWLRTSADAEHEALLRRELERDRAALLTQAEREEFDLRESPTAKRPQFQSQMTAFQGTEAEYRAVFALQQAFDERFPLPTAGAAAETARLRYEGQAKLEAEFRAALGNERYADWKLAGQQHYQALMRLGAKSEVATAVLKEVAAIVTETTRASWRISEDATQSGPQRKAALAQQVARARAEIEAKLGPDLAASYLKGGTGLITMMEQGSAVFLNESGGFGLRPVDYTPPPAAPGK